MSRKKCILSRSRSSISMAAQWMMRGTNHGSMLGMSSTGRTVAVPGADFITIRDDKIASVQGYFDSRAVPDQLDMAVVRNREPSALS